VQKLEHPGYDDNMGTAVKMVIMSCYLYSHSI